MVTIAVHRGLSELHHCVIHSAEHTSHCVNATSTLIGVWLWCAWGKTGSVSYGLPQTRQAKSGGDGHRWKRVVSTSVLLVSGTSVQERSVDSSSFDISGDSFPCADVSSTVDGHRSSFGVTTRKSLAKPEAQHCSALFTLRAKGCRSVTDAFMVQVWRRHVNTPYPTLQALSRADMSQHDQNLERAIFFQIQDRAFVCRKPKNKCVRIRSHKGWQDALKTLCCRFRRVHR